METNETISVTGIAKEDENRAGMCSGQMTGCSSSYSRKYGLCGLLAVNEEKDLDALDNRPNQPKNDNKPTKSNVEITATNIDNLADFCTNKKQDANVDKVKLFRFYEYYLNKLNNGWTGNFNVEQLWNNWIKPKTN